MTPRQNGKNKENLIHHKKQGIKNTKIVAQHKTQLVINNDLQVDELIHDYCPNFVLVTKTWLIFKESEKEWLNTTYLNKNWHIITMEKVEETLCL